MDRARSLVALAAFACAALPSCIEAPPPYGEAIVVVDTDAPVPLLAGRLRVDFYDDAGRWFESRDIAAPERSAWPLSFSVYNPDESTSRSMMLRLRVYPEGKTRDYRGERFMPRGGPESPPDDRRLVVLAERDITPRTEPQPLLTIDRLLRIDLTPGTVGRARVLMRGACFGTMANLATGESCIDEENVRVPLVTTMLESDTTLPRETLAGEMAKPVPCAGTPRVGEVCIPGGVFVFGNANEYGHPPYDGVPERVAIVRPFYMDKYEMTVARWREAYAADPRAFGKETVILNEGPLENDNPDVTARPLCTASVAMLGREEYALTCVGWKGARALCNREGGDLPTEVQWEYVAQMAGRATKSYYAWGEEPVTCERVVHGRLVGDLQGASSCTKTGSGPLPVTAGDRVGGDVTPLGVVGLGGGVAEYVRDAAFAFDSACWSSAGLVDPICPPEAGATRSIRGGGWSTNNTRIPAGSRRATRSLTSSGGETGLRCVRSDQ